jgi:predicted metal-dependent phosphoesterase TrpH
VRAGRETLKLRVDLHVHSAKSVDSHVSLDEAVERCRMSGLDGLAITDHDLLTRIPGSLLVDDLILFSGVEISARGAHILAFDISEEVPPDLSITETVSRVHELGGIAVIAHPYSVFRTWVKADEIRGAGFDAVEVANAYQFPYGWMLEKNRGLAEELGLPQTGGSDAHIPGTIGRAYTVFEAETSDVDGILSALLRGKTEAAGSGVTLAERLRLRV